MTIMWGCLDDCVNLYLGNIPVSYPLKTLKNIWFSGVLRGSKMGALAKNRLNKSQNFARNLRICWEQFKASNLMDDVFTRKFKELIRVSSCHLLFLRYFSIGFKVQDLMEGNKFYIFVFLKSSPGFHIFP